MCFRQLIIWIWLLPFATPVFAELTQKNLKATTRPKHHTEGFPCAVWTRCQNWA